jgi:hypothetical protein
MSHANIKDEIRALGRRDHRSVIHRLVSLDAERLATRSAAPYLTHTKQPRPIQ